MSELTLKEKETISEIYLLTIMATDTSHKISFVADLYVAIRAALKKCKKFDQYRSEFVTVKIKLYSAWTAAGKRLWPAAEQDVIEAKEILTEIGFIESLISVKQEKWNLTQGFTSCSDEEESE